MVKKKAKSQSPAKKTALNTLDVRPDRVDIRDREYQPALRSLEPVYPAPATIARLLPKYRSLVLDQGQEGRARVSDWLRLSIICSGRGPGGKSCSPVEAAKSWMSRKK